MTRNIDIFSHCERTYFWRVNIISGIKHSIKITSESFAAVHIIKTAIVEESSLHFSGDSARDRPGNLVAFLVDYAPPKIYIGWTYKEASK